MKTPKTLFSVLLDKEDSTYLEAVAKANKQTKSQWVRETIRREARKVQK